MESENQSDMYVAAKVAVINRELQELFTTDDIKRASFSEALTLLEKQSTKLSLDNSIHSQDFKKNSIGFVEQFMNNYSSFIYEKIFKASKGDLKELLNTYYLKYQIHNIIVTLRCIASSQKDVSLYLIGNKVQKEHCIKAVGYSYDEALKYFSTKFKFPKSLLEFNSIESIMQLETTLYKWYHEQLQTLLCKKYEGSILQKEHKNHIDVINKKIKKLGEEIEEFNSEEFFIKGGYEKIESISTKDVNFEELDELQRTFKINIYEKTKFEQFGTHFMILNFLQKFELNIREISVMLKEKALQ